MHDIHLIGYTSDLEHLVVDLRPNGTGTHLVKVDADLFATLDLVRTKRIETGLDKAPASIDELPARVITDDEGHIIDLTDGADDEPTGPAANAMPLEEVDPRRVRRASSSTETETAPKRTETPKGRSRATVAASGAAAPTLSPAQIQAQLRAGKTPEAVARAAGTDVARIERWAAPVRAELGRVLADALSQRLDRQRLGLSAAPLDASVYANLADKDVDLDTVTWRIGRKRAGMWKLTVRYRQRSVTKNVHWTFEPSAKAAGQPQLEAVDAKARALGFRKKRIPVAISRRLKQDGVKTTLDVTAADSEASTAPAKAKKKPAKKKSTAKKAGATKKSAAKASTGKKKSTAKKAGATKNSAAKASTGKKKSTAKKAGATKKSSAKKKPAAKKKTSPAGRKKTARKSSASGRTKKSPAKRSATSRTRPTV